VTAPVAIRAARSDDHADWLPLWRSYCAALEGNVSEEMTGATWSRILAPDDPIACLVAVDPGGKVIGFATYFLHPGTWSLKPVCYLEDLFVAAEARGGGIARALIERLAAMGREAGWLRLYWHTRDNNYRARMLYDRVAKPADHVRYHIDLF